MSRLLRIALLMASAAVGDAAAQRPRTSSAKLLDTARIVRRRMRLRIVRKQPVGRRDHHGHCRTGRSQHLVTQQIGNMVEESSTGDWAVWVEHDDHVVDERLRREIDHR